MKTTPETDNPAKNPTKYLEIDQHHAQQRVDNFLMHHLKGVPRSHVYRIIRTGQVRVNKKRVKPTYRLQPGDVIRIPPIATPLNHTTGVAVPDRFIQQLKSLSLFEDDSVWVINKPPGIAVHAGTSDPFGIIEGLRVLRPELGFLELVHRLDKETSGCLILAKQRSVLTQMHAQIRNGRLEKEYLAILHGRLIEDEMIVTRPLLSNQLQSGERMVVVDNAGKSAETHIHLLDRFKDASLVKVRLITGRKHQIRVHTASLGHPVLGDRKYGNKPANDAIQKSLCKRLFLHAHKVSFELDRHYSVMADMPEDFQAYLKSDLC